MNLQQMNENNAIREKERLELLEKEKENVPVEKIKTKEEICNEVNSSYIKEWLKE